MGLLLLQVVQIARQAVHQVVPVHAAAVVHLPVEVDVPHLAAVDVLLRVEVGAHQTVRLVVPERRNLRDVLLAPTHVVENVPKPVQIIAARTALMDAVPDAIMVAKTVVMALVAPHVLAHVQAVA